ncbi:hypothetical protein [Duganella sp. HH105]|uniref:hypothetical protein n=1 Tax=Duganella sp. HH105 TaxID=1781067 RepID=UPI000877B95A|nr:hypothetical protein [Duganella sp. HH105]OEZ58122.1 hypothetical protein DUGA6_40850 [Duganella sp. HH105]
MTLLLYFAATLAVALGLAHSILGERYILIRLFRRDNLPPLLGGTAFTIGTLRFVWHETTVALWGFAALLVQLAQGSLTAATAAQTLGWTLVAAGLLPLLLTRGRHLSWLALFVIGGIALAQA